LLLRADLFQIIHDSARRKHAVIGGRANAESAARVESAPELVGDGALTAGIETGNGLKIAVDDSGIIICLDGNKGAGGRVGNLFGIVCELRTSDLVNELKSTLF
jgi:deoxyxylulose-5-phosphate synthase